MLKFWQLFTWSLFSEFVNFSPKFVNHYQQQTKNYQRFTNQLKATKALKNSLLFQPYLKDDIMNVGNYPSASFHWSKECLQSYKTCLVWFGLVSLFNGITTFMSYLVPNPSLLKDSSDTIYLWLWGKGDHYLSWGALVWKGK